MPDAAPGSSSVFDQFSLAGKTALVTGASRGLGRVITLALADAGADVALVARDAERLAQVAAEVATRGRRAVTIPANLVVMEELRRAVESAYEAFERIDVLVCNAGISPIWKRSTEVTEDEWDAIMITNVKASFFMCTTVGQRMASLIGTPRMAAYGASKAAVAQLTKTLALEWADRRVRVNAIAPGYIETDMTSGLLNHPYWGNAIRQATPMGRPGQPHEIAGIAVYLASDASSFATGQVFVVDGGMAAG